MGFHGKLTHLELDPFTSCPLTPGPLGWNDHASPDSCESLLGIERLHLTVSWDRDLHLWDYDPLLLLDDPKLSPNFVQAAHRALATAVQTGLCAQVHEAYRSPEESERKHKLWKKHKGGRAADAWRSCHNYGLAMDVWLYDRKQSYIDNHVKGWYTQYKHLAKALTAEGFFWGEGFGDGDSDHFEFHPNWKKGADGAFLLQVKNWAEGAALSMPGAASLPNGQAGPPREPSPDAWMPFYWWAAGAGGSAPAGFKAPPTQKS